MKESSIENISVQKKFGYCGIHTLANALKDHRFKKLLDDKRFKVCTDDNINLALSLSGYKNLKLLSVAKIDEYYGSIDSSMIYHLVSQDNKSTVFIANEYPLIPYFLTVKLTDKYWHSTCILKIKDKLIYSDPYFDKFIEIESADDLNGLFLKCVEIQRICKVSGKKSNYISFFADRLGFSQNLFQ